MKLIENPPKVIDEVMAVVRRNKLAILKKHNFDVDSLLDDLAARQVGDPRFVSRESKQRDSSVEVSSSSSTAQ